MFAAIYWFLCGIFYVFSFPVLILLPLFKLKYKDSIPARFFPKLKRFNVNIWIHACSLGEVNSIQKIVEEIVKNDKNEIIISTITNTGYKRAVELFGKNERIIITFLPFEIFIPFLMPKNIEKLLVLEAELWFMLFFCAKKRHAKTILLNARISNKSLPKYKKFSFFYKKIFQQIDIVLCQGKVHKERLEALGAKNVKVFGNIKVLNLPKVSNKFSKFSGSLIVGASTHSSEEELIIKNYLDAFGDSKNHRLIIAPRHPERFSEVWEIIQKYEIRAAKFSEVGIDYNYDILLMDKLGELINLYNIANLVILGGSFVQAGGHNPLECAFFGTKILSGIYIFNQYELFELIEGYKIIHIDELLENLKKIESLPSSYIKNLDSKLEGLLKYI